MLDVTYGYNTKKPTVDQRGRKATWNDDGGLAWRVVVIAEDKRAVLGVKFAREIDAIQAKSAIEGLQSWEGTMQEIFDRSIAFGIDRIRTAMVGAMAW